MFVTPAFAQAAGGGATSGLFNLMPLLLIFGIMYFLLIRPQQKKAKQHQATLNAIRRGDKVVTAGGIVAKVVKVGEDAEVEVEIATGVKIRVIRTTIATVLSKTEPADS